MTEAIPGDSHPTYTHTQYEIISLSQGGPAKIFRITFSPHQEIDADSRRLQANPGRFNPGQSRHKQSTTLHVVLQ